MEKAIFPMKYLNISQGMNGSYSHKGTMQLDLTGSGTGIDDVFAPYTGIIKKIYPSSNAIWLESINPVKYADGTEDYMTILFIHDNDISNLYVGKVIKQGEIFYQEGTKGNATGNHIQINVGRGKFTDTGWHANEYGNWEIDNEIDPTKALWLKKDTIIKNDGGYNWKVTDTNTYEPYITYTVKPGDTLSGIASKYNINWHDLYNANISTIGANPNNINVGQVLTIPNIPTYIFYTVVASDNLHKIASKFNTTWEKIYNDNKDIIGSNPNLIKVGQKLKINK